MSRAAVGLHSSEEAQSLLHRHIGSSYWGNRRRILRPCLTRCPIREIARRGPERTRAAVSGRRAARARPAAALPSSAHAAEAPGGVRPRGRPNLAVVGVRSIGFRRRDHRIQAPRPADSGAATGGFRRRDRRNQAPRPAASSAVITSNRCACREPRPPAQAGPGRRRTPRRLSAGLTEMAELAMQSRSEWRRWRAADMCPRTANVRRRLSECPPEAERMSGGV